MQTDNKEKSTITVNEADVIAFAKKIERNQLEDKNFSEKIDDYINGKLRPDEVLRVGTTPFCLREVGADAIPLVVTQSVIANSMENTGTLSNNTSKKHTEQHNVPESVIKNIPQALRNPVLICKGNLRDTLVVISDQKNKEQQNIIVPMVLNVKGQHGRVNRITTIHGKKNIQNYLNKAIKDNTILAMNTKKADELFSDIGIQSPQSTTIICFDNSIAYSTQNVKHPEQNIQAEVDSSQEIKRNILSELNTEVSSDGNFKVNPEYFRSLPRDERVVEQFPSEQALDIMQQLSDRAIDFSAVSRKNDMTAITVSKSDIDALHDCVSNTLSSAQINDEIENPNKYESVSKSADGMKSLYSIEQNGETRYYLNTANSMRDLLETCSIDTPYAALMKCGEQISEDRFAVIQQGENFAFSLDINFDEDSVSIYKVNGGVSEIDRDDSNTVMKNYKLSSITEHLTRSETEKNENSDKTAEPQQISNNISEKINPEYYKQLKKDERSVMRMPPTSGEKVIAALQAEKVPFSAVKGEKLTSITVHKDNVQTLNQIISDNDRQTAKDYINSDFFKNLPPEERLYTQVAGIDKANELITELKNSGVEFSAVVDKEKNSAKVTVDKKDTPALKKATTSLFSRKAQKNFSDKAKSQNAEHDTIKDVSKNKDTQHSI